MSAGSVINYLGKNGYKRHAACGKQKPSMRWPFMTLLA
jgi:hypothetical protein